MANGDPCGGDGRNSVASHNMNTGQHWTALDCRQLAATNNTLEQQVTLSIVDVLPYPLL